MSEKVQNPISVVICDDDEKDLERTRKMVTEYINEKKINIKITCYTAAAELLSAVRAGEVYQLLLLDVMLGDSDGISLATELRNMKQHSEIIFVSSNRDMALLGYEVDAARYIAKPLDKEKLEEALHFCFERLTENRCIMLPTRSGSRSFELSAIRYIEPCNGLCCIHPENEEPEYITMKFRELSEILPSEQFVQVHRTLIVNMADIRYIRRAEIELCNGEKLPVSKYRIDELRSKYLEYMEK